MELRSLLRGAGPAAKASGKHGRAVRLAERGRTDEAFELTKQALDLLEGPGIDQASPPVLSVVLVTTVLHADLAAKLGRPSAADGAVRKAIKLAAPLADDPKLRGYVEWLQKRT
jgi:hypothetical protein